VKSSPNSTQAKEWQNFYMNVPLDNPCFKTACLGENVKKFFSKKVAQNVPIFQKKNDI